jgi:hypothetical protein
MVNLPWSNVVGSKISGSGSRNCVLTFGSRIPQNRVFNHYLDGNKCEYQLRERFSQPVKIRQPMLNG